jgi:hypothetical protein
MTLNLNDFDKNQTKNEVASKLEEQDPKNINRFKETFINILISYFKNNIILLNNLVELSDKIVMKKEDLTLLISILLERPKENIFIDVLEDMNTNNCLGKCCKQIPQRYKRISKIQVDEKLTFGVMFKYYYTQLENEFNINLNYVIV